MSDRTVQLEHELALTQTALHRLVFLLQERRLLSATELDAVRELLPPVVVTSRTVADDSGADSARVEPAQAAVPARSRPSKKTVPAKPAPASTDRQQIGRLGAHVKWAQTADRTAATQPARDGLMKKFEDQVDPDRVLETAERAKRAESARKAHYQRMSLKAAQARKAKKGKQ